MSCDLTMHVEIKVKGKWEHYNSKICFRDYDFFGIIGGVRVSGLQIFENKGLPNDLSVVTEIDKNNFEGDYHNASWLTPDELKTIIEAFQKHEQNNKQVEAVEKSFGYLFGSSIWEFNTYREDYPKEIEDVRVVIWFDN